MNKGSNEIDDMINDQMNQAPSDSAEDQQPLDAQHNAGGDNQGAVTPKPLIWWKTTMRDELLPDGHAANEGPLHFKPSGARLSVRLTLGGTHAYYRTHSDLELWRKGYVELDGGFDSWVVPPECAQGRDCDLCYLIPTMNSLGEVFIWVIAVGDEKQIAAALAARRQWVRFDLSGCTLSLEIGTVLLPEPAWEDVNYRGLMNSSFKLRKDT